MKRKFFKTKQEMIEHFRLKLEHTDKSSIQTTITGLRTLLKISDEKEKADIKKTIAGLKLLLK